MRRTVDLKDKPAWFLALSPLGKTPVLQTAQGALFESAVICEYLDEIHAPRLHPEAAFERARHRAWIEFGSALLNGIAGSYNAAGEAALAARVAEIRGRFEQLESELGGAPDHGQWFAGERFSLVDAVFGPVMRYFDVFDEIADFGFFRGLPRLSAWRARLAQRESIRRAVGPDYPTLLGTFLRERCSALSRRMAVPQSA